MLEKYLSFFRAHERAILILTALAVIGFGVNKYLDKSYDSAVARNQAAQEVLKDQVAKNADLQKQQDSREQQYQTMLDTLTRQNQSLVSAVAARNQTVAVQQHTDAGIALPELALRHEALLGVSTGVQSTENGFLVTPPVELRTVQALETLPVLQANLKDEQSLSANKDQQIAGLNGVVTGLNGQIGGLQLQITDAGKACDARVSVAKRSRWKWFKAGIVLGFGSGVVVGRKIP